VQQNKNTYSVYLFMKRKLFVIEKNGKEKIEEPNKPKDVQKEVDRTQNRYKKLYNNYNTIILLF